MPTTTEIYTLSLHDALPISSRIDERLRAIAGSLDQRRGNQVAGFAGRGNNPAASAAKSSGQEVPGDLGQARRAGAADRKSTRLNSSHTVISYAVFCLKKKKK